MSKPLNPGIRLKYGGRNVSRAQKLHGKPVSGAGTLALVSSLPHVARHHHIKCFQLSFLRLVFIGRNLDRAELESGFKSTLA